MPRGNDGQSIPFRFDEGKSVILQRDKGNRTHRRVEPSGKDAVASESQQEGCSRSANDISKETR
jgi:hypothetical protein